MHGTCGSCSSQVLGHLLFLINTHSFRSNWLAATLQAGWVGQRALALSLSLPILLSRPLLFLQARTFMEITHRGNDVTELLGDGLHTRVERAAPREKNRTRSATVGQPSAVINIFFLSLFLFLCYGLFTFLIDFVLPTLFCAGQRFRGNETFV